MRVTESMIARNLLKNIQQTRESMYTEQNAISTGKKVQEASDDPVRFSKGSRFRNMINKNEQYLSTLNYTKGWISTTTEVLDQIHARIMDAKEIATQAADLSSDSTGSRQALAEQVDDIIEEIVSLGNSTYMDKYLFGGTLTKGDAPFTYDGTAVNYQGNSNTIYRRVADRLNVAINVQGSQLVNSQIFSSLIDLRSALENDDDAGISQSIDDIKDSSDQLLSINSAMGSLQKQLETTQQRLETANLNLKSYLSKTEDTDITEAITNYNAQEMAYKAALKTTSDAIHFNILNFIG